MSKLEMGIHFIVTCVLIFLTLVHGYTPTFRNEATHPLKTPTESTLQMNEESSSRTKSNIQKPDAYYSGGGKHFEYMLLNDSNVLLTSLQNDTPFDSSAEQTVPSKENYNFIKSANSPVADSKTVANLTYKARTTESTFVHRTNDLDNTTVPVQSFDSRIKVPINKTVVAKNTSSDIIVTVKLMKQPFDISSTTKLYSKHANKSEENFASFKYPPPQQPDRLFSFRQDDVIQSENLRDTNASLIDDVKKSTNVSSSVHSFPMFNFTEIPDPVQYIKALADSHYVLPSIGKLISILGANNYDTSYRGTAMAAVAAASESTVTPPQSTRPNNALQFVKLIVIPGTFKSMPNFNNVSDVPVDAYTGGNKRDKNTLRLNTSSSSLSNDRSPPYPTTTNIVFPSIGQLISKMLANIYDTSYRGTAVAAVAAAPETTTMAKTVVKVDSDALLSLPNPPLAYKANRPVLTVFGNRVNTDLSNENPLAVKSFTDSSNTTAAYICENSTVFGGDITKREELSSPPSINVLTNNEQVKIPSIKPFASSRRVAKETPGETLPAPVGRKFASGSDTAEWHVVSKKSTGTSDYTAPATTDTKKLTFEFRKLIEKLVKQFFYPVAKYASDCVGGTVHVRKKTRIFHDVYLNWQIEKPRNVKIKFNSLGFANTTEAVISRMKTFDMSLPLPEEDIKAFESKNKTMWSFSNWTNLHEKTSSINLDNVVKKLFYEVSDANWIILLSLQLNPIKTSQDFTKYFRTSLAAKLSLEFDNIKVNAIVLAPSNTIANVGAPKNDFYIDINEEMYVSEESYDFTDVMSKKNQTWLEIFGLRYNVAQFVSVAPPPSNKSNSKTDSAAIIDRKHDDIEFYIFVLLGALCMFGILSPLLYGVYRLIQIPPMDFSLMIRPILRNNNKYQQQQNEKADDVRCESLNVIFSEDFDRKYTTSSWFDNTQHSSSILKPTPTTNDVVQTFFTEKDENFAEFCDVNRNPFESSPRLNKENKLNMLSCRPSCVLLPRRGGENPINNADAEERYFENPNYEPSAH